MSLIQDPLPTAIAYSPASLQVNDRNVSDAVDNDEGSVQAGVIQVQLARSIRAKPSALRFAPD